MRSFRPPLRCLRPGGLEVKRNILVVNAGSSSLKFAVWPVGDPGGEAVLRGQISSIGHVPHFKARRANGHILADTDWGQADGTRCFAVLRFGSASTRLGPR